MDEPAYILPGRTIIKEILNNHKQEEVKPMQLEINANAISMSLVTGGYHDGNVYYLTHELPLEELADELGKWIKSEHTPEEVILRMHRTFWYSYIGPEILLSRDNHPRGSTIGLHWEDLTGGTASAILTKLGWKSAGWDQEITATSPAGLVQAAQSLLLGHFNLVLHKDASAFANAFIDDYKEVVQKTAGDMGVYYNTSTGLYSVKKVDLVKLLMNLNGIFANRGAVLVGEGFKDGNPMAILAQPVFRDGQLQGVKLQEQRMGRFLTSIFGNAKDFRPAIDDLKVYNKKPQSYLCVTEEEWYNAYEQGPGSCMTDYKFDCSPVRVYATTSHGLPDNGLRLCINYTGELFGKGFRVLNRAIVNINTKEYVRAYGENGDAVMRSLGYERDTGATDGAILAKIPHPRNNGAYLMPYLDGSDDEVDDNDDHWVITCSGDYGATDANGYIYAGGRCCDCCDERVDEDSLTETAGGDEVCGDCLAENYVVPLDREEYYHRCDCTHSEYEGGWVYDSDVVDCPVYGCVYYGNTIFAQGQRVHEDATEWCEALGDHILTEEAAANLDEPYLGRDEEDTEEEAA
ncbi:gp9 [Shigella phage Buco]|uniref:Uncharacterized protein n=1 Tax=Shigella phage Buco TaxID=2530183 RepID=A0A482JKR3_9CAUD|nr:gp9 [Shigella phage Buco]QBP32909.1 hypothetical protein HRP29_gp9 [Shigella phage Buco]